MSTYVNPSVGILNHGWGHSTDDSRMATDALHPWHMSDMLGFTRPDICRHASVTSAPDIRFSASVDFDIRFPTYVRTPTDAYGWSVNPIRGHPCSSVGIRGHPCPAFEHMSRMHCIRDICHGCIASKHMSRMQCIRDICSNAGHGCPRMQLRMELYASEHMSYCI